MMQTSCKCPACGSAVEFLADQEDDPQLCACGHQFIPHPCADSASPKRERINSETATYRVRVGGEERGPFTLNQMRGMWQAGQLTLETEFTATGISAWHPCSKLLQVLETSPEKRSPRSRLGYIFLGLFLGTIGAHNFYAGHATRGLVELVLFIAALLTVRVESFGLILLAALAVWAIAEIVWTDRDGDGLLMT